MPKSVRYINRNRLDWIPAELRFAHEYCFFLHDEGVRLLVEYEAAGAGVVSFEFSDEAESQR